MTKQVKEKLDTLPYYKSIVRKYRYTNPVKDKAWSLLSDYVRCRDVLKYGTCISSGRPIKEWRNCDAGHFYSMDGHGALIGFDVLNVHAQSKNDNQLSSMHTGAEFEKNLVKRYGKGILEYLRFLSRQTTKADDWFFIMKIEIVWELFKKLEASRPDFNYPSYLK